MEQEIRFCTTSDGVRIAYATVGEGPSVVRAFGWFTHLEFEWGVMGPVIVAAAQATGTTSVRYDGRGMGLSDRDFDDFSLDAQVRDLEAAIDAVGAERVALNAISQGGPTAITYAVRHPERVSRILLYGSFARLPWPTELAESLVTVARHGWGQDTPAFRQMFSGLFFPEADPEFISWFTELQRVSTSPETAARMIETFSGVDVRHLLPEIGVPVLVVHRRGDAVVPLEAGRELAAGIPGARLVVLEGRNHVVLPSEPEFAQFAEASHEFFSEDVRVPEEAPVRPEGLVTILFTDIESSTALTQRLGDSAAQDVLHEHNVIVRDALRTHGGTEVKHTGDGIMASFSSASRAIACAIEIQEGMGARNEQRGEHLVKIRIGLNAGEPIPEDEDLFGTAVITAARIADEAVGGQILVSDVVKQLAAGKNVRLAERGEVELRGFDERVRLYEVLWRNL